MYICLAERGWSVSVAAPASTSRGPSSRHAREPFSTPRRIFTDSGTDTAFATASAIRQARSGSSSRCAPAPVFVTFRTGQPKFMSTMSAPGGLDHPRRLGHRARLRAEDLDRERMLVGRDPQVAERPLVPVLDPGAGDHLGADEPGPVAAALAAERLDADAGHRREDDPGRDLDVADPPGLLKVGLHKRRIVPGAC